MCDVEHVLVGAAAVEGGVEERLGDAVPLRPELAAQPVRELVVHRRHRRQHLLVVRQVGDLRNDLAGKFSLLARQSSSFSSL